MRTYLDSFLLEISNLDGFSSKSFSHIPVDAFGHNIFYAPVETDAAIDDLDQIRPKGYVLGTKNIYIPKELGDMDMPSANGFGGIFVDNSVSDAILLSVTPAIYDFKVNTPKFTPSARRYVKRDIVLSEGAVKGSVFLPTGGFWPEYYRQALTTNELRQLSDGILIDAELAAFTKLRSKPHTEKNILIVDD